MEVVYLDSELDRPWASSRQVVLVRSGPAEIPTGLTNYSPFYMLNWNDGKIMLRKRTSSLRSQFWVYSVLHLPLTSMYFPGLTSMSFVGTTYDIGGCFGYSFVIQRAMGML